MSTKKGDDNDDTAQGTNKKTVVIVGKYFWSPKNKNIAYFDFFHINTLYFAMLFKVLGLEVFLFTILCEKTQKSK